MYFFTSLFGLGKGLQFGMDPGVLGPGFSRSEGSSTGPAYRGRYELPEAMTSPGQAQRDARRAAASVLTFLALFLDDSHSPHSRINVFSSTSNSYFLL